MLLKFCSVCQSTTNHQVVGSRDAICTCCRDLVVKNKEEIVGNQSSEKND